MSIPNADGSTKADARGFVTALQRPTAFLSLAMRDLTVGFRERRAASTTHSGRTSSWNPVRQPDSGSRTESAGERPLAA